MSSFFHSSNDVTSSTQDESSTSVGADDDVGEPVTKVNTLSSTASDSNVTESLSAVERIGSFSAIHDLGSVDEAGRKHSQNLLHALLHDRCLNEALEYYREQNGSKNYVKDHPEVQALGERRYQYMTEQLGYHGLIPIRSEVEDSPKLRHAYSQGLDILSNTSPIPGKPGLTSRPSPAKALDVAIRKLSLANTSIQPAYPISQFQLARLSHSHQTMSKLPPLLQPLVEHRMFEVSRYRRDFLEVGVIGKGGYGKVYHVKHKLDGADYAIKKINLSSARIQRIEERGEAELDRLLTEVRTLARFDHPNIVRYYGGWLEYTLPAMSSSSTPLMPQSPRLLEGPTSDSEDEASALTESRDATDSSVSQHFPFQEYEDLNVVFEWSVGEVLGEELTSTGSQPDESRTQLEIPAQTLRRRDSESTTASAGSRITTVHSVGDDIGEQLETVPEHSHIDAESTDPKASSPEQITQVSLTTEAQLTLHIQMSLHPLSLADFLSPAPKGIDGAEGPKYRHCFHSQMSLRILLAILDGVQYLHSEGVVHRDLKPSNIFLSMNRSRSASCVDLSRCAECKHPRNTQPFLDLRIGDFGLVTEIAQPGLQRPSVAPKVVGTELYRPAYATAHADENLDVFALGIIATELLVPFGTRMERQEKLQAVRSGKISQEFIRGLGDIGKELVECIQLMTCHDEERRLSCSQVRERIDKILE
jgi:translation initiation factor 2-alpha kinase 3